MRPFRFLAFCALALPATARLSIAQPLASRIASAPDGRIVFRFASRPGVCGDGEHIIGDGDSFHVHDISSDRGTSGWRRRCEPGPVRVVLERREGRIASLRTYVGEGRRSASATDLGMVGAREGTEYLLGLAERASGSVAEDAILPAVLADSVVIWPQLLRIARAGPRSRGAQEQARFWLAQIAADKVLGPAADEDEPEDDDVEDREKAVFALSQLDNDAGVPALIQVARTHRMPQVRRQAMFWLGQSEDDRALALFEELLKGK